MTAPCQRKRIHNKGPFGFDRMTESQIQRYRTLQGSWAGFAWIAVAIILGVPNHAIRRASEQQKDAWESIEMMASIGG